MCCVCCGVCCVCVMLRERKQEREREREREKRIRRNTYCGSSCIDSSPFGFKSFIESMKSLVEDLQDPAGELDEALHQDDPSKAASASRKIAARLHAWTSGGSSF